MVKPLINQPPQPEKKPNGRVTLIRRYELITPLFGGGVRANEVDTTNPIRGTAVRGQLRFWWRATRGGQFGTSGLADMKAREDVIWGAAAKDKNDTSSAQPVRLIVHVDNFGTAVEPFIHEKNKKGQLKPKENNASGVPAYAAFPLQRSDDELKEGKEPHTVQQGIVFTLELNCHEDHRGDVEMALWAWETFGGIGARTRRGFGALHCLAASENGLPVTLPAPPCEAKQVKEAIRDRLQSITGEWPAGVPHLGPKTPLEIMPVSETPMAAWNALIDKYRAFRQSREGNEYGPTHWPEGNAVRRQLGKKPSSKSPDMGPVFPRAQLGLPILFHFPQEGNMDATLKGASKERMASRLILRPLACGQKGGLGLAAALAGPSLPDDGIELDGTAVNATVSAAQAKKIEPLDGVTNLLKAFFIFLRR